jgi:hypothetical protein
MGFLSLFKRSGLKNSRRKKRVRTSRKKKIQKKTPPRKKPLRTPRRAHHQIVAVKTPPAKKKKLVQAPIQTPKKPAVLSTKSIKDQIMAQRPEEDKHLMDENSARVSAKQTTGQKNPPKRLPSTHHKTPVRVKQKKVHKKRKKSRKRKKRTARSSSHEKLSPVQEYSITQRKLFTTLYHVFFTLRKRRRFIQHNLHKTRESLTDAMRNVQLQTERTENELQQKIKKVRRRYNTAHQKYHRLLRTLRQLNKDVHSWKDEEMRAHEAMQLLGHTSLAKGRQTQKSKQRGEELKKFFADMRTLRAHVQEFGNKTGQHIDHHVDDHDAVRQFMKKVDTILGKLPKKEIVKFSHSKNFAFYKHMMEKYAVR